MTRLWKWALVCLAAAGLTAPLLAQTASWGEGDQTIGTECRFWNGTFVGYRVGDVGTFGWDNRTPYDPNALFSYRYGVNNPGEWTSNRFVSAISDPRWVCGVQPTPMAPGRYRLDDLYMRMRFTQGGTFDKATMAVVTRSGDFLTRIQDTTGTPMEWEVTTLAGAEPADVYLSDLPGYTPVYFDVSAGDDVWLWCGYHCTGVAIYSPQINTIGTNEDFGGGPPCTMYKRTTASMTAPIEGENVGTATTSCLIRMTASSGNRILYQGGIQAGEGNWLDTGETEKTILLPAGPEDSTYWVIFHGFSPGDGNYVIADFNSCNWGDGQPVQCHLTMFQMTGNASGANDGVLAGSTTASATAVALAGKVEKDSSFDVAIMVRGQAGSYTMDPFWQNRTEGMGTKRNISSGTTASVSGTTVTAAAPMFQSSDVGKRLEFPTTGGLYEISTFSSSTVITVASAPTETTPGLDINVVNPNDRVTIRHLSKLNGSRGAASYTSAGDRPAMITISDALGTGVIQSCTVAWQPVIQLGDSNTNNWQALGTKLPGSFTFPRSYWWASIGGSTADRPSTAQTTGDQRFCNTTPGWGDTCEMNNCLFVWSSYGTNDIWQMEGYPTINEVTQGIIRSAARCQKEGSRWSHDSDWLLMTTTAFLDDSQTLQDAAINVATGLAGLGACGMLSYFDIQPTALSNPAYMNADGVHLTEEGCIAVSAAAASRYESGQSSR